MYEVRCDTSRRGRHEGPLTLAYQDGPRVVRHEVPAGHVVDILPGAGGYAYRTGGHYDLARVYAPGEALP